MAVERRGATRFKLALPVYIGETRGFTRNIGIGGALIVSPRQFVADDPIDLIVEVSFSDPDMPTRLHCVGRVRRARKIPAGYALAVGFNDVHVLAERGERRELPSTTRALY